MVGDIMEKTEEQILNSLADYLFQKDEFTKFVFIERYNKRIITSRNLPNIVGTIQSINGRENDKTATDLVDSLCALKCKTMEEKHDFYKRIIKLFNQFSRDVYGSVYSHRQVIHEALSNCIKVYFPYNTGSYWKVLGRFYFRDLITLTHTNKYYEKNDKLFNAINRLNYQLPKTSDELKLNKNIDMEDFESLMGQLIHRITRNSVFNDALHRSEFITKFEKQAESIISNELDVYIKMDEEKKKIREMRLDEWDDICKEIRKNILEICGSFYPSRSVAYRSLYNNLVHVFSSFSFCVDSKINTDTLVKILSEPYEVKEDSKKIYYVNRDKIETLIDDIVDGDLATFLDGCIENLGSQMSAMYLNEIQNITPIKIDYVERIEMIKNQIDKNKRCYTDYVIGNEEMPKLEDYYRQYKDLLNKFTSTIYKQGTRQQVELMLKLHENNKVLQDNLCNYSNGEYIDYRFRMSVKQQLTEDSPHRNNYSAEDLDALISHIMTIDMGDGDANNLINEFRQVLVNIGWE